MGACRYAGLALVRTVTFLVATSLPAASALAEELRVNSFQDLSLLAGADECRVAPVDNEQVCTLRAALEFSETLGAQEPILIVLPAGEYVLDATLESLVIPGPNVSIHGDAATPDEVVIRPGPGFDKPLLVSNFGAANATSPKPELRNLTLRGARSTVVGRGGAIDCENSRIALDRVHVVDNQGVVAGGARLSNCNARIANSEFAGNFTAGSQVWAGAVDIDGAEVEVSSSSFIENRSSIISALRARNAVVRVSSTAFHGNIATTFSGSTVFFSATAAGTELANVSIVGNTVQGNAGGTPGFLTPSSLVTLVSIRNSVIAGNILNALNVDVRLGPGAQSGGYNRIGKLQAADPDMFGDPDLGDVRDATDAGTETALAAMTPWGFPRALQPVAGGPLEGAGAAWDSASACAQRDAGARMRMSLGGTCDIGAVERFDRPSTWAFKVDDNEDVPDSNLGDGLCRTQTTDGERCTLRAAVDETNALFLAGHLGPYDIELPANLGPYPLIHEVSNPHSAMLILTAEEVALRGTSPTGARAAIQPGIDDVNNLFLIVHRPFSYGRATIRNIDIDGLHEAGLIVGMESVENGLFDSVSIHGGLNGVWTSESNFVVEDSRVFDNGIPSLGSAIVGVDSSLVIRRSVIHDNLAGDGFVVGMTVAEYPPPNFKPPFRSQFALLASTLSNNVGATILELEGADTAIWNSTIVDNTAADAAIHGVEATLEISHSAVARNAALEFDGSGGSTVRSFGANAFGDAVAPPGYGHEVGLPDIFGADATLGLEPFEAHETWAGLMPMPDTTNIAFDAGSFNAASETAGVQTGLCLAYDQRNLPRAGASSSPCDLGALEYFSGPLPQPDSEDAIFSNGFE